MNKLFLTVLLSALLVISGKAQDLPIIPYPANIEVKTGQFQLSTKTQLVLNDNGQFTNEVSALQSILYPALGQYLSVNKGDNTIVFNYSSEITSPEEYKLDITPQSVTITAGTPAGAFYAVQTIRQLLPIEVEQSKKISSPMVLPALSITDKPAFEWRGSHIDVARHFFSLDYLKRHIDRLSYYKMNKFHIHLTDDQGWRVEIKKYPKLTSEGAWRNYNNHDSVCIKNSKENPDFEIDRRFIINKWEKDIYGGYFTQDQIKELVKYAESKHVELIPEVDMPGHMAAAISAYPFLAEGKTGWGKKFSVPICPCNDDVYTFIDGVLDEIIELFPSKYIHVGADEVEKITWEESEACKKLMEREGLKNVNELQSYFVHHVQDYVESKGKKLIGWDEVLQGGINSNVDVMFWRGWIPTAPATAVKNGNYVIMTPTNPMYFDFLPNKSTLYNVYHMDVIYDDIPKDKVHLIRGAQANMWAERIPSENRADFMLFPRMTALAERVWTNKNLWDSYSQRILKHYPRLDVLKVNYRLPDVEGFAQESVFVDQAYFDIKSPLESMKIHYTTDGSMPSIESLVLNKPYLVNKPQQIKFALFSEGGVRGEIHTINYKQSVMKKAISAKAGKKGLKADFYDIRIDKTTKITGKPNKTFVTQNVVVPKEIKAPSFGVIYNGYIKVPETGIYSFYFTVDDSGKLYIDNEVIVDNEGPHSPVEKSGQAALEKGLHPFKIEFVEGGGGYTLRLEYSVNGSKAQPVPDSWFLY